MEGISHTPLGAMSTINRSVRFRKSRHGPSDAPDEISLIIRTITPDDEDRERTVVREMSMHSKYLRFFVHGKQELSDAEVRYYTAINYRESFALAVVDPESDHFVAIARYIIDEAAVLVLDEWQGYGIGEYLTNYLFEIARREGRDVLRATVLRTNAASARIFEKMGQKYKTVVDREFDQTEFTYFLREAPTAVPAEGAGDPTRRSAISRKVRFTSRKDPSRSVELAVRPITPDDELRERTVVKDMSLDEKYQRFFFPKGELSDEEVYHFTHIDYRNEFALVAVDPVTDRFACVARYMVDESTGATDVAVLVLDKFSGMGIASYMLTYLFEIGKRYDKDLIIACVMSSNRATTRILEKLAAKFYCDIKRDGANVEYRFHLQKDIKRDGDSSGDGDGDGDAGALPVVEPPAVVSKPSRAGMPVGVGKL